MSNKLERLMIFTACAVLPALFWPAAGLDEQFYLVKQAGLEILAAVMLAARFAGVASGSRRWKWPPLAGALVLAWFAASLAYSPHPDATLSALAYFASLVALCWLSATHAEPAAARRAAAGGTVAGALVVCAFGVLDFFGKAGTPLFIDWGSRTASLFSDPNMFGIYLLFPLLLGAGRAVAGRGGAAARAGWGALAALSFLCLVFSYSRSAWVALGWTLAFYAAACAALLKDKILTRFKPVIFLFSLFVVFVLGGLGVARLSSVRGQGFELPARLSTISLFHKEEARPRVLLWQSAGDMMRARPVQGWGLGTFTRAYVPFQLALRPAAGFSEHVEERSRHAYNDYLEIGSETGLIGLGLWVVFLGIMLWRAARRTAEQGAAALAMTAACFGYFVDGALFQYPLYSAAPAALGMVWLGVLGLRAEQQKIVSETGKNPVAVMRAVYAALIVVLLAGAAWFAPRPVLGYVHFNQGGALEDEGREKQALDEYRKAVKWQPSNPAFQFRLGRAYLNLSEENAFYMDRAEQALIQSLDGFPYFYATHQLLGSLYRRTGRTDLALEQMKLAEDYYFGDRTAMKRARIALLLAEGRADQAIAVQKDIVKTNSGKAGPVLDMARLYSQLGRPEQALKTLKNAGALRGADHAEVVFETAAAHMAAGKFIEAQRSLKLVIGRAEAALAPYVNQDTGRLELDKVSAARSKDLLKTSKTLARALYITGRCFMELDDPETALEYFHDAHNLTPSEPEYVYWGGVACERLGQYACAVTAWNAILELHPDHQAARKALQDLPRVAPPAPAQGAPQ